METRFFSYRELDDLDTTGVHTRRIRWNPPIVGIRQGDEWIEWRITAEDSEGVYARRET